MDTETSVKLPNITKVTPTFVGDLKSDGENDILLQSFAHELTN